MNYHLKSVDSYEIRMNYCYIYISFGFISMSLIMVFGVWCFSGKFVYIYAFSMSSAVCVHWQPPTIDTRAHDDIRNCKTVSGHVPARDRIHSLFLFLNHFPQHLGVGAFRPRPFQLLSRGPSRRLSVGDGRRALARPLSAINPKRFGFSEWKKNTLKGVLFSWIYYVFRFSADIYVSHMTNWIINLSPAAWKKY